MLDVTQIDLVTLEAGLRGLAIGAFAATGAALAASRRLNRTRWIGVTVFVCAIAHVIDGGRSGFHPNTLAWMLSVCAPGVFWLFTFALFEDEPQLPPWGFAVPLIGLGFWALGALSPPSLFKMLVWRTFALYSVAVVVHVLVIAWRGWRNDLIDQRRRLRAPLAAAAAGYMFVQAFCDFGWGAQPVLPAIVQAAVLAALGVGGAVALLRVEPLLLETPTVPGEASAPRLSDTLDLTPADRLVLARLDKAMNENEVWRGEDLSIGALAALVGAPEHRLRKLINGTLGHRNFADYVNGRRIEAAKVALADPEQALKSVSTIAFELGFASLGPFNRAFRSVTGVTPTAWRQEATPAIPHLRLVETGEHAPKAGKSA